MTRSNETEATAASVRRSQPVSFCMLKPSLLLLALLQAALTAAPPTIDPTAVRIPEGRSVLLDGRIEAGEWDDAVTVALSPGDEMRVKRNGEYLLVAVRPSSPLLYGVNLYFTTGRQLVNLHASAKLGERVGTSDAWPEWSWWNNNGWAANVARGDDFEKRRFLRDDAKEFQIHVNKLGVGELLLSVDVETREGATALPVTGLERFGKRWLRLVLNSADAKDARPDPR